MSPLPERSERAPAVGRSSERKPTPRRSRVVRILAAAAYLALASFALLELTLPLLESRYERYFRRAVTRSPDIAEELKTALGSRHFDPDLGWTKRPPVESYQAGKPYLAQAYGDSFTLSRASSGTTWEEIFEGLTGHAILNFGVGGYGLDQAVLAFEKYGAAYGGRLALLGLYHQMYRRAHAYHSFYYFQNPTNWRFVFKPMLARTATGFELLRPPCADAACLEAALFDDDHPVRRTLEAHDHWYRRNAERPPAGFPRTLAFARALPEAMQVEAEAHGRRDYFFVNEDSLDLVMTLVMRFVHTAEQRGMTPIMLLIYSAQDLEIMRGGVRWDEPLLARLDAAGLPRIDTSRYIFGKDAGIDLQSLRTEDGHMNESGDRLIAEALADGLGRLGQLR